MAKRSVRWLGREEQRKLSAERHRASVARRERLDSEMDEACESVRGVRVTWLFEFETLRSVDSKQGDNMRVYTLRLNRRNVARLAMHEKKIGTGRWSYFKPHPCQGDKVIEDNGHYKQFASAKAAVKHIARVAK